MIGEVVVQIERQYSHPSGSFSFWKDARPQLEMICLVEGSCLIHLMHRQLKTWHLSSWLWVRLVGEFTTHFSLFLGAPPIVGPIVVVGLGSVYWGYDLNFEPWPYVVYVQNLKTRACLAVPQPGRVPLLK